MSGAALESLYSPQTLARCDSLRCSHYENIIKELRTEVAELRAAALHPVDSARLPHENDAGVALQQPSSLGELDGASAELRDTVDSIEQTLRRIADMEANCIDVNYTRVRQQRLIALGQEDAAASLAAGSSSGLIDPEFDPLLPRASGGSSSLAAQR